MKKIRIKIIIISIIISTIIFSNLGQLILSNEQFEKDGIINSK